MIERTASVERHIILSIRVAVGVLVSGGALAGLWYAYDRVTVMLAMIFALGLLQLVIEYTQAKGDPAA